MRAQRYPTWVVSIPVALTILVAGSANVTGQNSSQPSAASGLRAFIVTADGNYSTTTQVDQLKIRTAGGELGVRFDELVYMYRGRARLSQRGSILTGEVLDAHLRYRKDDGSVAHIPTTEVLLAAPVSSGVPPATIGRLEIIVAGGKATMSVFAAASERSTDKILVSILDEYSVGRSFTLSDPAYQSTIKLPAERPFVVDASVTRRQRLDHVLFALGYRAAVKGTQERVEGTCYWPDFRPGELVDGVARRAKAGFTCFRDLSGTGDLYLYVAQPGAPEMRARGFHDKDVSPPGGNAEVRFYRTVSNVLKLPVRFE